MRFINVRQLLRNVNEEVKDLPFVVTRYGRPIFIAIPPKGAGVTDNDRAVSLEDVKDVEDEILEFHVPEKVVEVPKSAARKILKSLDNTVCSLELCNEKAVDFVGDEPRCEKHSTKFYGGDR